MKRALACLALLALACGPKFTAVDVTLLSTLGPAPDGVLADDDGIELAAGQAIIVRLVPDSKRAAEFEEEDVVYTTEDSVVFTLYHEDGAWEYVLIANAAGESCIAVEIRGEEVDCVPVRVTD